MLCRICKCEMRAENPRYTFTGDESAETETRVYMTVDHVCRNKNCEACGEIAQTTSTALNAV